MMRFIISILHASIVRYWTKIPNSGTPVHCYYLSLYETLEKEKTEEKRKQNDEKKILLFKVFCIENFREFKKMGAEEALLLFSKHKVFDFLEDTFEMLHTQDSEYIIDTITTYIKKRK